MNCIFSIAATVAVAGLASPGPFPAVTASFSQQTGVLTVIGDSLDNDIVIRRTTAGGIQVLMGDGSVRAIGGTPTIYNTKIIVVRAGDGDDHVRFDESNGALPAGDIDGGIGCDVLTGGDGNDRISGGAGDDILSGGRGNDILLAGDGNDVVLGQDGSDLLIWNNGDGSDFMEGGEGFDFVQVNGANDAGDSFRIDPNGERVRFRRTNLDLFTLDIGTAENLDVNGQGGSDVIIGSVGLNGLIGLDLDGGEGNDLLIGGDGVDVLRGGAGNDVLLGEEGRDIIIAGDGNDFIVVNEGDGSDLIEGGPGRDTVQINGSDTAGDDFSIEPDGERVRFQRNNLGLFTLNIGTTENLDVNGQGGSDVIIGSTGLVGLISLDIDGGDGDDFLVGGDGADRLFGRDGNDVLIGQQGNDFADGGPGRDVAYSCERVINVP